MNREDIGVGTSTKYSFQGNSLGKHLLFPSSYFFRVLLSCLEMFVASKPPKAESLAQKPCIMHEKFSAARTE